MCYRIVYCSRNRIEGSAEEVKAEMGSLLLVSRRNNAVEGITGALLFNGEAFAQVLEGPQEAVEKAFERIRWDSRHSDVVILEQSHESERHFSQWAMAYADDQTIHFFLDSGGGLDVTNIKPHNFASLIVQQLRSAVSATI